MPLILVESVSETLRSPIATFVLLLAIALLIPPIFERLKLPGLVGLLVAGVVFGSSSLGWLDPASETMKLLSEIGKIYLMFVAGLEIDLALFKKTRSRSLTFGTLTFIIPFIGGIALGLFFNFSTLAAVLIGSLLASHTLLAYPILQRLRVISDEAITITVGATIVTDITALIVLAICLGINRGDFDTAKLLTLLGSLTLYTAAVLIGLKQLAIAFFRATGKDEGNQFLFVMLSVFLVAVGAQIIGVENIIGAFLAGLAVNSVIGEGPVKEKTEFLGNVLFIPMFFINMGLLLNLDALGSLLQFVQLPIAIVSTLLVTKLLASLLTKWLFRYSWLQAWTMWSLSIPQVAATLAAALVGYEANIINAQVFNSVILLMLVTAILGPLVTARTASQLALEQSTTNIAPLSWLPIPTTDSSSPTENTYTVVVPVYNPRTESRLLELAAIITQYEQGRLIALSVAIAQHPMDSPQTNKALTHSHRRLESAKTVEQTFNVPLETALRIDYGVPQAISHFSREQQANLVVLGMRKPPKLGPTFLNAPLKPPLSSLPTFTAIQDAVLQSAHCPVLVAHLLASPTQFKKILLPVEIPSEITIRVLRLAQVLASINGGSVTLLHVCRARSTETHQTTLRSQLQQLVNQLPIANCQIETSVIAKDNWIAEVTQQAQTYDLVIVRSQRRRIGSGIRLGTNTQPLVAQLNSSVILVGEPGKPS